jgi:hypothetical protein
MCNIGTVSCCLWNTQASDYRAQCLAQLNGKGTDRQATFVNCCETEGHMVINLDSVSVSIVESRYDMFVRVLKKVLNIRRNHIYTIVHYYNQQDFMYPSHIWPAVFSFYTCLHFENIDFPILCEIQTGLQTDVLSDLLNNQILLSCTIIGFFCFYLISKSCKAWCTQCHNNRAWL